MSQKNISRFTLKDFARVASLLIFAWFGISGNFITKIVQSAAIPDVYNYPVVHLEIATEAEISGWALDISDINSAVNVRLYIQQRGVSGINFVGTYAANLPRPDLTDKIGLPTNAINHGFKVTTPAGVKDGDVVLVYISNPSGWNPLRGTMIVGAPSDPTPIGYLGLDFSATSQSSGSAPTPPATNPGSVAAVYPPAIVPAQTNAGSIRTSPYDNSLLESRYYDPERGDRGFNIFNIRGGRLLQVTACGPAQPVIGWIESTDQRRIIGWAYDVRDGQKSIQVRLYVTPQDTGVERFVGSYKADIPRPEFLGALGMQALGRLDFIVEHGYNIQPPSWVKSGDTIRVTGMGVQGEEIPMGYRSMPSYSPNPLTLVHGPELLLGWWGQTIASNADEPYALKNQGGYKVVSRTSGIDVDQLNKNAGRQKLVYEDVTLEQLDFSCSGGQPRGRIGNFSFSCEAYRDSAATRNAPCPVIDPTGGR